MPVVLTKKLSGNTASVEQEIRQRLQQATTDSFLYIVPTKRKIRDLQRAFLKLVPRTTASGFFLFTLETLASRLYQILCSPQRPVAGPAQAVLIKQAIDSVAEKLQYIRLHGSQRWLPKGTLDTIVSVINKLKESGIYPAQLYAELQDAGEHEKLKLRDILSIYEEYEKVLDTGFIDPNGMLKHVNAQWNADTANKFKNNFSNVDTIFVSGFDEFSDPELTLLHNVSEIKNMAMMVEFDYHLHNNELFGHLKENYSKLLGMGFEKVDSPAIRVSDFHNIITQHLFQYSAQQPTLAANEHITILDLPDRRAEVEAIAKVIKQLAHQHPERDLSKICVAFYQPQLYTTLFRETFERYGIPVNITDRFALDQSSFVTSLLALLDVQRSNFRLRDIMRALSSPYFRFVTDGRLVDAGNLYKIAARLKISQGYSTWLSRIGQELSVITSQRLIVDDEGEEAKLVREELALNKAKHDLEHLSGLLRRFRDNVTPHEFKERLVSLMNELCVVECLLSTNAAEISQEQLEKDARAYQKFLHFLDEFLSILALQNKSEAVQSLSFYAEQLRAVLAQVRYNVYQQYGYGVLVTSFEETRGLHFDVMILAGLVDGEFPPIYQPEIFFSESRRIRHEQYHLTKHRYMFYQAMTNFSEHLYVCYPRKDGDIELVRSSFLDALFKIVHIEPRQQSDALEYSQAISSEDEFLLHYGLLNLANASDALNNIRLPAHLQKTLEHMNHTMSVERSRTETTLLPEYDGIIFNKLSSDARQELERFRNKIFSVTQLETYGKCPFQYFADRVLRLNVVSEIEEGLTPLERGGVLHEILFEFYVNRRERELPKLSRTTDEEFRDAVDELLTLARIKIDELKSLDIFSDVEKELLLGAQERKGILRELLEHDRGRELDVEPKFFELAFGSNVGPRRKTDPSLQHEQPLTADNVQLRGKIDRVELGTNTFTIIDYKTGAALARRKEIDLGISLQLPLYLYAVENILLEKYGHPFTPAAGIYYSLRSPVKEQLGIGSAEHKGKSFEAKRANAQLTETDDELKRIIGRAIQFVNKYVDGIAQGKFPVKPQLPEETCTYCDFKKSCRIQTQISLQETE